LKMSEKNEKSICYIAHGRKGRKNIWYIANERRMKILGIETSCDETAAAVVQDGRCAEVTSKASPCTREV